MLKHSALLLIFATSIHSGAEMISIDSTCAAERNSLRNIASRIPAQVSCRAQIDQLAKCCAGDSRREDCVTPPVWVEGKTGQLNAAQASSASFDQMIAMAQNNIDRCNRQLEKVRCSERPPMMTFQSAVNTLNNCLQQGQDKMAALKGQADATAMASASERAPAAESAVYGGEEAAVQNVDYDPWTTIQLKDRVTGEIKDFNTRKGDCASALAHFGGARYSIQNPGGCR